MSAQERIDRHMTAAADREALARRLRLIADDLYSGVLVEAANPELCPPRPRHWWRLWTRPGRHKGQLEVFDYMMHADYGCRRCGLAWRYRHNLGY